MLEIKDLNITKIEDGRKMLDNFTFTLNDGDKAVIIGEEGNGKSTLLKLIYDENLIQDYCLFTGNIVKKGIPGYLPQNFSENFKTKTVKEFLGEITDYTVFNKIGLSYDFIDSNQIIRTLSGGEKIKLALAKILMKNPDFLLLDEPTNDIDIKTLEWLENFINSINTPVMYISHDETMITNTANVIIHLELIKRKTECRYTIERIGYEEYITKRKLLLEKQEQIAKKQISEYKQQKEKWFQVYNKVDHQQRVISRADPHGARLLKKKMKSIKSHEKRFERQKEDFIEVPDVEESIFLKFNEQVSLPNSKRVIDFSLNTLAIGNKVLAKHIKFMVVGKEHVGIIGKNGVGKTTLLNKLWEEIKDRKDINAYFMPQDYSQKLDYSKTPIEFLVDKYSKHEVTKARTFMGNLKFTHKEMTSKIGNLSGGQRAKILFLEMVLNKCNVLLLDEPTRNFSPLSNVVIRKLLSNFNGAIISVSHDRKYLHEVCDTVYELKKTGLEKI